MKSVNLRNTLCVTLETNTQTGIDASTQVISVQCCTIDCSYCCIDYEEYLFLTESCKLCQQSHLERSTCSTAYSDGGRRRQGSLEYGGDGYSVVVMHIVQCVAAPRRELKVSVYWKLSMGGGLDSLVFLKYFMEKPMNA